MVPEFVDRIRGSNRVQALPAGTRWQSALPTVDRTCGSKRFSGELERGFSQKSRLSNDPGKEEILCELPGWVPPRC